MLVPEVEEIKGTVVAEAKGETVAGRAVAIVAVRANVKCILVACILYACLSGVFFLNYNLLKSTIS